MKFRDDRMTCQIKAILVKVMCVIYDFNDEIVIQNLISSCYGVVSTHKKELYQLGFLKED